MRRLQFSLTSLLWLIVVVSAFFGGFELARLRGEVAKDKVLDELRTEAHVSSDMRQIVSQLRDDNRRLTEMLKIEKQRIGGVTEELAIDDSE